LGFGEIRFGELGFGEMGRTPVVLSIRPMLFCPYGSRILLVVARQVSSRNSDRFPEQGHQTRGGEKALFSNFMCLSRKRYEIRSVTTGD